jgi:hypothetical protein
MRDESEFHQAMLERQQMLEEALERAEAGVATEADWNTIRFECGVYKKPNLKTVNTGANHEFDSESK